MTLTVLPSRDETGRLRLTVGRWYGWQMLPGYGEGYQPYFSPIYITAVRPHKAGTHRLGISFFNAHYTRGVRDFDVVARVVARRRNYRVVALDYPEDDPRIAVISQLSAGWLQHHAPGLIEEHPPTDMTPLVSSEMDYYLNMIFFGQLRPSTMDSHDSATN